MGDVSDNFSRSEFACKCGCGFNSVDVALLDALEQVREKFGPVSITSGNRCPKHNAGVGGAAHSYHTKGLAADFKVGASPTVVQDWLCKTWPNKYGKGRYPSWNHLDVRDDDTRWSS